WRRSRRLPGLDCVRYDEFLEEGSRRSAESVIRCNTRSLSDLHCRRHLAITPSGRQRVPAPPASVVLSLDLGRVGCFAPRICRMVTVARRLRLFAAARLRVSDRLLQRTPGVL